MTTAFKKYKSYLDTKNIHLNENQLVKLSESFLKVKNNECTSKKAFDEIVPDCFPNIAVGYLYLQEFGTKIKMYENHQPEMSLFGKYNNSLF